MTAVRYLLGLGSMAVALTPVGLGSRALTRRYLPELTGPAAWVASTVISLSIVVVVSEALGSVGLFALLPIVASFAAAGLASYAIGNRGARSRETVRHEPAEPPAAVVPDRLGTWGWAAACASVAVVVGEWSTRTADSLRHGMVSVDTLWYHLPVAARFADTGWTSHLHFVDPDSLTVFYPATAELFHALGIVFLGNDTLSPVINLGWLALALLSAWCIGRPFGVAPLTLIGAALFLATPVFTFLEPGGGLNDIVGLALFLAAVALLVNATRDARAHPAMSALGCAALATGLALGTKYTFLPPALALGIGVAVIGPRGERGRRTALWFAVTGLTGGYWYVRNLATAHNPLPPVRLGVGSVHLHSIPTPGTASVAKYLFNGNVWSTFYVPGVRHAFGSAWWVLLAVAAVGLVLGLLPTNSRMIRMLALVGAASFGAYVVGPQVLGNGLGHAPIYFSVNLRYAAPGLVLGALVLPVAIARHRRWVASLVLALYAGALAATQLSRGIWQYATNAFSAPPVKDHRSFAIGLAAAAAVAVAAVAWRVLHARARQERRELTRDARVALAVVVGTALCASGFAVERNYQAHRYTNAILLPQIYRWARTTHDTRIAIVGFFLQYPLYGNTSSNFVQFVAIRHNDGTSSPITDCATWRRTLDAGRYRYVVVTTKGFPFPSTQTPAEVTWTRSDPTAALLIHEGAGARQAWLYRISGPLDPGSCG